MNIISYRRAYIKRSERIGFALVCYQDLLQISLTFIFLRTLRLKLRGPPKKLLCIHHSNRLLKRRRRKSLDVTINGLVQVVRSASAQLQHGKQNGKREKRLVVEALCERKRIDLDVEPLGDAHRDQDLRAIWEKPLHDA